MTLRSVARLEGNQPVLGHTPAEWRQMGVTPGDLGLEDDEWYIDVVDESRQEALTIEQALERWPLGPWVGLCLAYDVPPGPEGFPSIYGACAWRIWCGADGAWRHTASIAYPTKSVRDDERWPDWLREFVSAAETAFGATCHRD